MYGCDHGKTALLCPGPVCQVRRTWDSHERSTAILVGSMMLLSFYMPRGGYDEETCIAVLETVKIIKEEGKKTGAKGFFIGGDSNIELKLEGGREDFHGLDSLDWYGFYGHECRGGGEDMVTCGGFTLATIIARFRLRGDEYMGEL